MRRILAGVLIGSYICTPTARSGGGAAATGSRVGLVVTMELPVLGRRVRVDWDQLGRKVPLRALQEGGRRGLLMA